MWEPGTKHGYHMRTYGWMVGELIRRVTGEVPGSSSATRSPSPLDLDFWIGLPEELEPRVARLVPPETDMRDAARTAAATGSSSLASSTTRRGSSTTTTCGTRVRCTRASCRRRTASATRAPSPASTRRASATVSPAPAPVRRPANPERHDGPGRDDRAGPGPGRGDHGRERLRTRLHARRELRCGQPAERASATPARVGRCRSPTRRTGIAFGYVMNDLRFDPTGDPRSETLVRAVYAAVNAQQAPA